MAGAANRIARIVAPHVRLSGPAEAAIDETVGGHASCPIDRCAESLQLLGRMGHLLRADPELLRSMLANDATVRAHPAIHGLARWLGDGAPDTLRLRIPPVVVSIVRAPFPAVFEVVEFRRPILQRQAATPDPDDEIEILRLILDVCHTAEAAAAAARITDPDRRCVLHNLVAAIFLAVVRVGTMGLNDAIEPGLQRGLAGAIAAALRGRGPIPTMTFSASGLEVGFRLGLQGDDGLPFRIVRVRDVA